MKGPSAQIEEADHRVAAATQKDGPDKKIVW